MPYMTRNPSQPNVSNFDGPGGYYQFYEQRYNKVGPQEWIFAPDAGPWYVALYFMGGAGSAYLEATDEPPNDLLGNAPNSVTAATPVFLTSHGYPLTETVSDFIRVKVEGATAVRVNVVGGTVDVTARA